ncbi:MAG: GNAT family N-acetyltransferase [Armatimonadota bacterium]|nr:GNAT family N-acetyltransferase [Armatimonadota bacterium]
MDVGTITIRQFDVADYPALVALGNAVYADYPWSEKELRHWDSRYDGVRVHLRRLVAEDLQQWIVGWAEYHHEPHEYHPQKLSIDLGVHPQVQGRGIGARLYDALLQELAALNPLVLWARARETSLRGVRFLERRGFVERRRAWESRLEVARFDPRPFQEKAERAVQGLVLTTVAEEREKDPEWLAKLYDLDLEVEADVPRVGEYTPRPFQEQVRHLLKNPGWIPKAHFLVVDGDRYVAQSNLFRSERLPDVLYQGITGTRRAYRGRGLALALKLRTVEYARRGGYREIRTWNDSLNAPMLHINTALGFVRQPAWITFEKVVRSGAVRNSSLKR